MIPEYPSNPISTVIYPIIRSMRRQCAQPKPATSLPFLHHNTDPHKPESHHNETQFAKLTPNIHLIAKRQIWTGKVATILSHERWQGASPPLPVRLHGVSVMPPGCLPGFRWEKGLFTFFGVDTCAIYLLSMPTLRSSAWQLLSLASFRCRCLRPYIYVGWNCPGTCEGWPRQLVGHCQPSGAEANK